MSLTGMTRAAVRELFAILRSTSYRFGPAQALSNLSAETDRVLNLLSLRAGSLSGTPFANLALSTAIEKHPFVQFSTGSVPLALRDSLTSLEQAFFELARRELADEKARGDLFERVTSRCIRAVCPSDVTELPTPLNVPIPNSRDKGEVDLAFQSHDDTLLIGECKAYFLTSGSGTVTNAFEDQMINAVKQLSKRVDAIRTGSRLYSAGKITSVTEKSHVVALGIPLHPYGAAVWNSDALQQISGMQPDLAIIPLHQLIIVIQTMQDSADLREYVRLRHRIQQANVTVTDEMDMLILSLNQHGRRKVMSDMEGAKSNEHSFLLPCTFSPDDAILREMPRDRNEWRRWLFASAIVDRSID